MKMHMTLLLLLIFWWPSPFEPFRPEPIVKTRLINTSAQANYLLPPPLVWYLLVMLFKLFGMLHISENLLLAAHHATTKCSYSRRFSNPANHCDAFKVSQCVNQPSVCMPRACARLIWVYFVIEMQYVLQTCRLCSRSDCNTRAVAALLEFIKWKTAVSRNCIFCSYGSLAAARLCFSWWNLFLLSFGIFWREPRQVAFTGMFYTGQN